MPENKELMEYIGNILDYWWSATGFEEFVKKVRHVLKRSKRIIQ